ncbi:MAG: M20 family metallo-hydrolase [Flavobacteriaceae bacterium]|nr:M20 family metallo-hydrolase [Flavobacteriaceae bacterium]
MQEQNLHFKTLIPLLQKEAIQLLQKLITIPSLSKEEDITANTIEAFIQSKGIKTYRNGNNIWCYNKFFDGNKPTILLNSHHDTVKPNNGYTLNPFEAVILDEKLYGLGSNDAGGALVSLLASFLYFYDRTDLNYNILYVASAEEEISGTNGMESILADLGLIEFAIVGEPTQMQLAIAEKGLLVLDCIASGKSGHAARNEGENAIYNALKDIEWFRSYQFPKISETLGPVKMTVTTIHSGSQHNVVPDICEFTVDIRTTDTYSNSEIYELIKQYVRCEIKPRSLRLNPSSIDKNHPIVKAGLLLGRTTYGSPTSSDQAVMNFPSLKMGPGDSARSHTADEFIYLNEIEEGINLYIQLLNQVL